MFGVWADLITRMGTTESSEKAWERGNKVQEECLHLVFFLLDGVKLLGPRDALPAEHLVVLDSHGSEGDGGCFSGVPVLLGVDCPVFLVEREVGDDDGVIADMEVVIGRGKFSLFFCSEEYDQSLDGDGELLKLLGDVGLGSVCLVTGSAANQDGAGAAFVIREDVQNSAESELRLGKLLVVPDHHHIVNHDVPLGCLPAPVRDK